MFIETEVGAESWKGFDFTSQSQVLLQVWQV